MGKLYKRLQPDTGEQYQLKPVQAKFFKVTLAMITAALILQALLLVANMQTRRRAEGSLESLRRLRLGSSSLADAQRILATYHYEEVAHGSAVLQRTQPMAFVSPTI